MRNAEFDEMEALEAALEEAYAAVAPPPGFAARVRLRARRTPAARPPSAWPEVLDFIGWAAVLAVGVALYSPAVAFLLG
jgi:hypothetical protein